MKKLWFLLASAGGLGYAPVAPGTFGTLAGLPIWWLCSMLSWPAWAMVVVIVCGLSIVIAAKAEAAYGSHDVQKIVIDEVAGMVVASFAVPFQWQLILPAFVGFRIFDALKPPPIGWLDEHMDGGLGVVLDDLAAGAVVCGLMHGAAWIWGGWW